MCVTERLAATLDIAVRRVSDYFSRRNQRREAVTACKAAALVLSCASPDSLAADSALRALLRHGRKLHAGDREVLSAMLQGAAELTHDPTLLDDIAEFSLDLKL